MTSIRETAKAIVAEMEGTGQECNLSAGKYFKRLAILDYAEALKRSPECTPETTAAAIERAYTFAERAIQCGVPEEQIDEAFSRLRAYWLPRLAQSTHGLKPVDIASGGE
jgi:hypothetical protein